MSYYPSSPYAYLPPPRRRRRLRWRCGCCSLSLLLLVLTPLVCLTTAALTYVANPPAPANIVILGIDARPGEGAITRTDSIMLMHINPNGMQVSLLSIPRDVYISVPGYGEQRINTINVLGEMEAEGGGPALVKASFEESFGIEVDYYVRLNFDAFVELVDAVGGVDIDVPKRIVDYEYPTEDGGTIVVEFEPGRQHMDGARALQYARTRHADDDYQRAGRQQQVLDAVVKKLANPIYWPAVLNVIQNYTDTDMSAMDMIQLGPALVLGWSKRTSRVLQREDLIPWREGVVTPDYEALQPWINDHFN